MDWQALTLSLKLAAVTTLLLVPAAILVARRIAWSYSRRKALIEAAMMLPLVLPPTVLGYYLLMALAPGSALGRWLASLTGGPWVFSFSGILVASLIANIPFALQPVLRAFEAIPANLREAAWVSGLSSWQTFRHVELPAAWPGIVSSIALVVAHTLGEFGVILMVGGSIPGETQTLSIAIYDRVQAMRDGEAAVMASVLLVLSLVALALVNLTTRAHRIGARGQERR